MDYGCGSGVLGMAACALSSTPLSAVGVDIDVDAVRIANTNSATNQVTMESYLPALEEQMESSDSESKSLLMKSMQHQNDVTRPLPSDKDGPIYDLVVANILAGPLVFLAPTLAGLTRPGGRLGLSGVLSSQADTVMDAYQHFYNDIQVEQEINGWILITGVRKDE